MRTVALVLMLVAAAKARAQGAEEAYFGDRQLEPSAEESDALQALEANRPGGVPSSKPVITADKSVRFVFGESLPVVICAPLQVCDIELQPGEKVRTVQFQAAGLVAPNSLHFPSPDRLLVTPGCFEFAVR